MDKITFEPMIPIWLMVIICIGLLAIKRKGIVPYIRQCLIVVLLFAINLRPMYISDEVKVMRQKLNCYCIIVIDDTLSMMAEDYNGIEPRMNGVKADVEYITDFSVIAGYGVMSTPALVVNEKVVSAGRVLKPADIEKLIK